MSLSLFDLDGRVAIVTGSGRGIGKAIALELADAGAQVVVSARTVAEIEATADEIRSKGRKALVVPTDIRDSNQIINLVQTSQKEFGKIDILVNNAAWAFPAPAVEIREDGWEKVIRASLTSVFLCSKAVSKVMIEQGKGNIINIASASGFVPMPRMSHYGAAKAGVINLTRNLAVEWGCYNIRVNAIAPGVVETFGSISVAQKRPGGIAEYVKNMPLGRMAKPEDVAAAAIYLASDASAYVTGTTIVVHGGLSIME